MAEAKKLTPGVLRETGDRSISRAQERAGSNRVPAWAWRPEIDRLEALGYNGRQIAEALRLEPRRIRQIRQQSDERTPEGGSIYIVESAKKAQDVASKFRPMLEFSAEGFRKFYDYFSASELPEHCYSWIEDYVEHRNLMLHVPPRHMKTTIFSVWVPIWEVCRDRQAKIIILSKTDEFARDQTWKIANIMETNLKLIEAFGRFKPEKQGETAWRPGKGELMVVGSQIEVGSGQFTVESRGMRQQILGREATTVIVDDPTDAQVSKSEEQRSTALDKIRTEAMSRLMPGGHAVIIGQRVHWKDIYGELHKQKHERGERKGLPLWTVINQPAVYRWDGEDPEHPEPVVLWPTVWNYDELMLQYERVGGYGTFECMYQQHPIPDSSLGINPAWWDRCMDVERQGYEGIRKPDQPYTRVVSIDPGVKRYHAITVADVDPTGERFACSVLEAKHWRGDQRSLLLEMQRAVIQYQPDYVVMERVSFTEWMEHEPAYQALKQKTRFIPHTTGVNRGDSERGVESLAHEIEFGLIRFPTGDQVGRDMFDLFKGEMIDFPYGEHDDVVMTMWFMKWNWRKFQGSPYLSNHTKTKPSGWRADFKQRLDQRKRAERFGRRVA